LDAVLRRSAIAVKRIALVRNVGMAVPYQTVAKRGLTRVVLNPTCISGICVDNLELEMSVSYQEL
jgi:hypothetical protein